MVGLGAFIHSGKCGECGMPDSQGRVQHDVPGVGREQ
jgi:hypothetical protein